MDPETLKQPLQRIREMISDIENGNFLYTVPVSEQNTEFAALHILMNMENLLIFRLESNLIIADSADDPPPLNENTSMPEITDRELVIATQATLYIKKNLRKRLPTTKQMSRILGTNEKMLKQSFSKMHGMGMHKFHNEQRLKKIHRLILKRMDLSIKAIVIYYGFEIYHSFYCAFVKQYHYAPQTLRPKITQNSATQ